MRHRLFVYGTLVFPELMAAIVGKKIEFETGILPGYVRYRLKGQIYPAIVKQIAANVDGVIYSNLSRRDLNRLDIYEGDLYQRKQVFVNKKRQAGVKVWTYILKTRHRFLLTDSDWDKNIFKQQCLSAYLKSQYTVKFITR